MTPKKQALQPVETIASRILVMRGQKVMIDADLAELYGVPTKRLNEQVRRNQDRFPADFIFELTADEFANLKSQFATSSWGGRRKLPLAFTEHGAIMTATVLNSPRAVEMSVYVVRAFVRLREVLASHKELSKRLDDLEQTTEALALRHDTFAHNTRAQLKQVFEAIRELMAPPPAPPKRPIGFVTPDEKPARPKAAKRTARK
ncbi:MAG: ORF6N domain-containing protein [Sterolibacterium sp.]